jgi:hypothetical protein
MYKLLPNDSLSNLDFLQIVGNFAIQEEGTLTRLAYPLRYLSIEQAKQTALRLF